MNNENLNCKTAVGYRRYYFCQSSKTHIFFYTIYIVTGKKKMFIIK